MPFVTTGDGTRLFYNDWGAGRPVIFLHGWCINSDSWEYVTSDLVTRGLRCIVYDGRGCGRSNQPSTGYDYDTLADDLAALLNHLDLRDVTLVGHSMGCGVIARYLTRHQSARVSGMVWVGTTTPYLLRDESNPDGIDPHVFDGMIAALRQDRPAYVGSLAPAFFGDCTVSPEMTQWAIALTLQAAPHAAVELLRANAKTDQRGEIAQITVPTLLVHGDRDRSCPLELTARPTHASLPHSRLVVYEGEAHGFYLTAGKRLAEDIFTFVKG